MIAVHLGGGIDGQVVAAGGGGQEAGFLLHLEQLDRPAGVGAVNAPAGPHLAPLDRPALGVG